MFVETGLGFQIYCDYTSRSLRVRKNMSPPGWHPLWEELTPFTDESAWYSSPLAQRLGSETLKESIAWFWSDLEAERPTETTHNTT